ncbi:MAG: protein-export chaperone SecB [Burkholderiales bacterium]|jgi:preprotein translocase subunit SecB|nr:protein-export chaperone SecB [Burkholderiales bacterium]
MANEQTTPTTEQINGQLNILKIYVKDLSIENPGAPAVFQQDKMPAIEMNLRTLSNKLGNDTHEAVLTVTLTFKIEDKVVLLAEIKQAGIFNITGLPEPLLQQVIAIHCPTILLPYAREVISSAIGNAGFPPFYLPPTNFEALYRQQQEALAKQAAEKDKPKKEEEAKK